MSLSASIRLVALVALLAGCHQDAATVYLPGWQLAGEPLALPARFDDRVRGQKSYELRTTVDVPPGAHVLVLPSLDARVRLSVDGVVLEPVGRLPAGGYRNPGPHRFEIPADHDGHLDLVLRVEHTWVQSAWINAAPRLVPLGGDDVLSAWIHFFNGLCAAAALVALFQTAVITALPFLVDRQRREYLLFGCQALLALVYPLHMSGLAQHVFGTYDTNVLAIGIVLAAGLAVHFTHAFFAAPRPSRWWMRLAVAACLPSVVVGDPYLYTWAAGWPTIGYVGLVAGYQLWFCGRLWLRGLDRSAALYIFLSWLVLTMACLPDFIGWLGLAEPLSGIRLASSGLTSFAFLLSMLFARRHTLALVVSDERVAQLEGQRREMKQLNEELRRQVEEKSSQIYAALALARGEPQNAPALMPGTVIERRYRVERRIGGGGMGDVYEITRLSDQRRLALKLAREVSGVALARLAREAQVACKVTHEHVVALLDVDVASAGFLYIVMELVPGDPLEPKEARARGPAWVIDVLRQVAEGLAALHAAGVVHRDLKPGNVLVTHAGDVPHVKISDFGIALPSEAFERPVPRVTPVNDDGTVPTPLRAAVEPVVLDAVETEPQAVAAASGSLTVPTAVLDHAPAMPILPLLPAPRSDPSHGPSSPLTRTGFVPGTPAYIAPELLLGRQHVSPAADMFAFGVMAYELLAGARPFAEPPVLALQAGHPLVAPRPLEAREGLPAEVARLCEDCLDLRPERRPSAREVAERLARLAR